MTFGSGYNQVAGPRAEDRGKKKKIIIIGVSSIILVAMVVAIAFGVSSKSSSSSSSSSSTGSTSTDGEASTSMKAIKAICQPTDYQQTCEEGLNSTAGNTTDPKQLIKAGFQIAITKIQNAVANSSTVKQLAKDPRAKKALESCNELMEYAIDDLQNSFEKLGAFDFSKLDDYLQDLRIWLSGSITYQQTCLDGFENTTGDAGEAMKKLLNSSQEFTSNGLAMVTEISSILSSLQIPGFSRRLLSSEESEAGAGGLGDLHWLNSGKRRLLEATAATIKADVIVAKDGSGKYKTVTEALKDIPKKGNTTFVIYVKEGVYDEHIMVDKSMTHVMMIGDGPNKTRITGKENYIDGTPTFKTATFSAIGDHFIAKDMGFENSAGAAKHQAVALRVQSDMSIFYNCYMDGYQDTLYVHAHRQFYRDCTITGTIDFIFGDAAAVFQNCIMIVRKPLENQQCIVTAQGRVDKREATAIILQNCTISADPENLAVSKTVKSYLGRPWKQYSRTIMMQTQIDGFIQPEGWLPWQGDFALKTLFYAEYKNRGNGSVQTGRVTWRGIKKITPAHAVDFTAGKFISGDKWIKPSGVPYTSGIMTL